MVYAIYADDELLYRSDIDEEAYQVVQPTISEELNKIGTLTFTMLPTNRLYDSLHPMKTVIRVESEVRELFRGRVIKYDDDIFGQRKVECEDVTSFFLDSVFFPDAAATKNASSSSAASTALSDTGVSDMSEVLSAIQNGDYGSVLTTVGAKLTASLSETWNNVKSTASYAYNYFQENGSLSGILGSWLSDYYSNQTGSSSGSTGSSSGGSSNNVKKESLISFFSRVLISHNSQVESYKRIWPGEVTIDDAEELKEFGVDSISDTRSVLENALIKEYGGFFKLRYTDGICFLDYLKEADDETTQLIQLGVNLEELTYSEATDDVFSILLPLGKNNGTIAKVNDGSIFLESPEYIERFGRIVLVKQWSEISDADKVKEEALKYLNKRCSGVPVTLELKAIDFHILDSEIDEICLGQLVTVYAPARGINVKKILHKLTRDLQSPENNSYTIGDFDTEDDDTTASYRGKNFTLSSLMGEVGEDGKIERHGLQFKIHGQFSVLSDNIRLQARNLTKDFSSTSEYAVGSYVMVEGKLYKCKTQVPEGGEKKQSEDPGYNHDTWFANHFEESDITTGVIQLVSEVEEHYTNILRIYTQTADLYGRSENNSQAILHVQDSLADAFSSDTDKTYDKGMYVLHDGEFYVATEATTGGAWDPSKWTRTNAGNGLFAVNGTLYATRAQIEQLVADEIEATKSNIGWMSGKTLSVRNVMASGGSFGALYLGEGNPVASQSWVESKNYLTRSMLNTYTIDANNGSFTLYGP